MACNQLSMFWSHMNHDNDVEKILRFHTHTVSHTKNKAQMNFQFLLINQWNILSEHQNVHKVLYNPLRPSYTYMHQ